MGHGDPQLVNDDHGRRRAFRLVRRSADTADFYANSSPTSTIAVNGNQNVGNITFDGSGYTITGGTLTLGSGIITTNQNAEIDSTIVTGAGGLTKAGNGTLILDANATAYSGPTTINAGTLTMNGYLLNSTVVLTPNGTLNTNGHGIIGGLGGSGTLAIDAGGNFGVDGNALYIRQTNAVTTFSGNLVTNATGSDAGIAYDGGPNGQLTLTGTNTFNGVNCYGGIATSVWSGTLRATTRLSLPVAGNPGVSGDPGVDFEGGVLR